MNKQAKQPPRKIYRQEQINMRYVGTWIPMELHVKVRALADQQDRHLATLIKRLLQQAVTDAGL